jgi:hypothetical protein
MNKYAKIALIVLALGITFTVLRQGLKKDAGQTVGESSSPAGSDQSTNPPSDQNPAGDNGSSSESDASKSAGGARSGDGDFADVGAPRNGVTSGGSTGAGGTSGSTTGATGANGPSPLAGGAQDPSKPANNCFSFEYRHPKEALNQDIEDFLDYSNAFPVLHEKVSQKSICVKVNNKPTAFKLVKNKSQQEIMIGSVVGPESVIKVSYCVGDATCKEACAIKSNRMMDDLMSDAGDEDTFKESWGEAAGQKKELQAKVKEFRNVASENKDLQKQSTVRVWDTLSKNEWFCKQ